MKIFFLLLILFIVTSSHSSSLSLHEAQQYLFENNHDVRTATLERDYASLKLYEAKAAWLPSLDIKGSYSWMTEKNRIVMSFPEGIPGIGGQSFEEEVGTQDRTELGFDVTYPLFTGFTRQHRISAQREGIALQSALLEGTKNRLSLQLGILFLQWQLSIHETTLYELLCRQLSTRIEQLEYQFEAGTTIKSRLLEVKARKQLAETDLVAGLQKADSLRFEIASFIGMDVDAITTPDTLHEPALFTMEDTIRPSERSRPEIDALDKKIKQTGQMKRIIRNRHIPTLAALAGYRYGRPGLGMGTDSFMGYGLLGLQLSWNLFSGFKGRAIEQQLQCQLDMIAVKKDQAISTFNKEYKLALQQLDRINQRLIAVDEAVQAAEALVADLTVCVEAGTATQADYLDALVGVTKTRLTRESIRTAGKIATLKTRFAAGEMLSY